VRKQVTTCLSHDGGFTFIELLLTSTLVVIVLGSVYLIYTAGHTTSKVGLTKADLQQNARIALDQMTREIRMAGYESPNLSNKACASKTATCVLPAQDASHIHVRGDIDGDNTTEEVEYELRNCVSGICELARRERDWNSTTSDWGAWSAYQLIAENVWGMTFTYLPSGNPKSVRVRVEVRNPAIGLAFTAVSDIRLRNL